MKQHTCKGLKAALKFIDQLDVCGPYNVPIFQENWICGKTTGYLGTDRQIEKALGGTLHAQYIEINYCPFCGFKYEKLE